MYVHVYTICIYTHRYKQGRFDGATLCVCVWVRACVYQVAWWLEGATL